MGHRTKVKPRKTPRRRKDEFSVSSSSPEGMEISSRMIPAFLKKTYDMVTECPPDIGGWTTDGDMFTVKDVATFTDSVLPRYFNSQKFSSWQRQLNFYGIRKVKTPDSGCATFYHPLFQRGRPKLLSQIKRSTHYGAAGPDRGEVQALKCEIADLKSQVNDVNDKIKELSTLLDSVLRHERMLSSASIEVCKNRKLLKRPPSDEFPTMITDDVNCDGSVKCFDPSFELPDQFPLEPTGCNVSDKGTDSVELTDMLMDDLDIPYYQQDHWTVETKNEEGRHTRTSDFSREKDTQPASTLLNQSAELEDESNGEAAALLSQHYSDAAVCTHKGRDILNTDGTVEVPTTTPGIAVPLASAALGAFLAQVAQPTPKRWPGRTACPA